ncbi:MFS transporter [Teratosphaeria nubilosa]|uniref:MFS transporter n=1 Tax=Teratosphaeria nubilosa TaxID=161662 RepID=A0A6G1L2W8_9PEZI|nr:MFS transporter [Teratosphaeria nubilosa]
MTKTSIDEKTQPFASLDGRKSSTFEGEQVVTVATLQDADEALAFLENHPRAAEIATEGQAILQDDKLRRRLIRKIDFAIAPLLASVYFLQYLDKTTLSYTAVMGMRADTHLHGQQYSDLGMLFYIGFLATEFPTQYLAQRFSRLSLYLGTNIILWGAILMCHAACTSFAGLAICRTLLGVFESCVAPILVLIIAMWYKKSEQGRRVSWFYVCNSLTQIIGGAVAYGASFAPQSGIASWRIFYLAIGALTIVMGALVVLLLPDSPVKARRFTDAEKVAALLRTKDNQSGTQNAHLKKEQVWDALKDVRVWLICLSTLLTSIPNGGISNFSSILLTTFGYTSQEALIMSMPAGAIGVLFVLLSGYLSDALSDRSLTMLICIIPTMLAAAMMIAFDPSGIPSNKPALLAASFLSGTFGAAFMLLLAWNASNIAGHTKKVTTNALTLVAFALGNILGTQTFQASQAPGYIGGKISIIVTLGLQCGVVVVLRVMNDRLNQEKERKLAGMGEGERRELAEKMAFADRTDRENVFFTYTH